MVEIQEIIGIMDRWISEETDKYHHIINSGMHGIMEAHKDPCLKLIMNSAELFAPDGILMVVVARIRGFRLRKRNTGPQLLWEFGHVANKKKYSYYLYGDKEETLRSLTAKLNHTFPDLPVVGFHSPPFRPLTPEEDEAVISEINQADPDVLWVGLGMPQQEIWIASHRNRLNVPVVVGAGAAFKLMSGNVRRAPDWLANAGFEWLWRFVTEPGRVWRRIVFDAPKFICLVALEVTGLKKYS